MKRILIVDDNASDRFLLRHVLSRLDLTMEVLEADSGPRALELLDLHSIDVAFLDVRMPGMDGFELLREIRRRDASARSSPTRTWPLVFMLSTSAMQEDVAAAYTHTANLYLTKPTSLEGYTVLGQTLFAAVLGLAESPALGRRG